MRPLVRAALVLLLTLVPALSAAGSGLDAHVVWVDDGDTIDVQIGDRVERVRYIGIDAPEIEHHGVGGAPGGLAAARMNAALVGGQRVRLELDREVRDRYGRLLAYVWLGERLINAELVRAGYARALVIPPNLRYARLLRALERDARAARRGLWGAAASSPWRLSPRIGQVVATSPGSWSTGFRRPAMTMLDPAREHVEVLHDKPGLCPECLDKYISGRGGGKVHMVQRAGKWVCPRSGPSIAQEFGPDTRMLAAGLGAGPMLPFPTISLTLGGGWLIRNLFRKWRTERRPKTEPEKDGPDHRASA